ncbi:MAG TPA: V-type ATPase 116kDa subunit family protein [Gaiellaceae bacterium]|nr:V-type ATPase 116kDa subunit family protein [Gaiellaceae bacterium]
MSRVAIVAPRARLREALVELADAGVVELVGAVPPPQGEEIEALRRVERLSLRAGPARPCLAPEPPDVAELERRSERELLAGEVELARRADAAVRHGSFAGYVGWVPESELEPLAARLAPAGAALVELPRPVWADPPTLLRSVRLARPFRPLVETYGAARYEDIDPTPFAAVAFVLMFGIMFGDVGQGLVLVLLGLFLRRTRGRLASLRSAWPLVVACGASGAFFGLLYGELFGPTGLVPTLWLDPLEEPFRLLVAAIAFGAVLLACSYAIGTVNRWRERGPAAALLAASGFAGFAVFLGGALALAGFARSVDWLAVAGATLVGAGVVLLGLGFFLEAGRGPAAVAQASVEVVDAVVRVAANAVSFARLAAFGLMHGALTAIVYDGAVALWGGALTLAAIVLFVVGNAAAFTLEALVAGVQALRLEYYELFSRIFAGEGRPFSPWSIPLATRKEES